MFQASRFSWEISSSPPSCVLLCAFPYPLPPAPRHRFKPDGTHPIASLLKIVSRYPSKLQISQLALKLERIDQRCQAPVEQCVRTMLDEGRSELRCTARLDRPPIGICRNPLQLLIGPDQQRRSLFPETRQAGKAIGAVARQRQKVRHAAWSEAAFGAKSRFIDQFALAPVDLDHALASKALPEVLVGCEYPHLLDLVAKAPRSGRKSIVRLVLVHRPYRHADCTDRVLRGIELRAQFRWHALIALVVRKQIVAKRANGIVERDRQVGNRLIRIMQQRQQRLRDSHGSLRIVPGRIRMAGTGRVVRPVQLVGAIDKVESHASLLSVIANSSKSATSKAVWTLPRVRINSFCVLRIDDSLLREEFFPNRSSLGPLADSRVGPSGARKARV